MSAEQFWHWLVVDSTLKGSLLLLAAGLMALALHRASAAARHLAWTAGLLGFVLLGPLSVVLPRWRVEPPAPVAQLRDTLALPPAVKPAALGISRSGPRAPTPARQAPAPGIAAPAAAPEGAAFPWRDLALTVWALGAAFLAACFAAGAVRLSTMVRRAPVIDDERIAELAEGAAASLGVSRGAFRLRWSPLDTTPLAWGFAQPFILLPPAAVQWEDRRLHQVLVHEIAHVQRRDVFTQALSSLACVVWWFNPLVWWAARQMLRERERACDDLVLAGGATPSEYAADLLDIARALGAGWTSSRVSPAMARRSEIEQRLLAVLDGGRPRRSAGPRSLAVAGGIFACALVPAASLSLARHEAAPQPGVGITASEATPAPDLGSAAAAIQEEQRAWRAAFQRRDLAALAAHYTTDAVLVQSWPGRGRAGARDALQNLFDEGVTDIETRQLELYPVGAMLCQIGRVHFRARWAVPAAHSRSMTLWRLEDGRWRIHRSITTQH